MARKELEGGVSLNSAILRLDVLNESILQEQKLLYMFLGWILEESDSKTIVNYLQLYDPLLHPLIAVFHIPNYYR